MVFATYPLLIVNISKSSMHPKKRKMYRFFKPLGMPRKETRRLRCGDELRRKMPALGGEDGSIYAVSVRDGQNKY